MHIIKEGARLRLREGTAADIDYVAAVDGAPENAAFVTQDTREIREKNVASPDTKYLIVERRLRLPSMGRPRSALTKSQKPWMRKCFMRR